MIQGVKHFQTNNDIILESRVLSAWLEEKIKYKIMTMVEEFQQEKSGWSLIKIMNLLVNINRYALFQVGLSTYVNLPKYIQKKKLL